MLFVVVYLLCVLFVVDRCELVLFVVCSLVVDSGVLSVVVCVLKFRGACVCWCCSLSFVVCVDCCSLLFDCCVAWCCF